MTGKEMPEGEERFNYYGGKNKLKGLYLDAGGRRRLRIIKRV